MAKPEAATRPERESSRSVRKIAFDLPGPDRIEVQATGPPASRLSRWSSTSGAVLPWLQRIDPWR